MRIVLDTNVLVAALVARGLCHDLLEFCVREHELFTSEFIITELRSALRRTIGATPAEIEQTVSLLESRMARVVPCSLPEPASRDPDDDFILATAVEARADCIVSGDHDLLVIKQYRDIAILSPREFWIPKAVSALPTISTPVLRFGHSPDPDDAFMFFGLARGAVAIRDFRVEHVLEDIQTLNEMAMDGSLEVTAISAHAYPSVADRYWIMHCGASIGRGYGPIVVALPGGPPSIRELAGRRVAIPGRLTTAYLVAQLYLPSFDAVVCPFDQISDRVAAGEVDAGLVIHEGQITYASQGLVKLADLGALWLEDTDLPLPLGLDVVRRDLGRDLAGEIADGLAASIDHAFAHEDDAVAYALQFGRGLDTEQARTFVKMYVNEYTRDMGEEGRRALETLFARGAAAGLISTVGPIELV